MIELQISTPALLFPAISLLLLAFTNRFLAIAALIRQLHVSYLQSGQASTLSQIHELRKRVYLIRNMQLAGALSFLLCATTMFLLYLQMNVMAHIIFGGSMLTLMVALWISAQEIRISVQALEIDLQDILDETYKQ